MYTTSPGLNPEGSEVSNSKAEYIYLSLFTPIMFLLDTSLKIVGLALRLKFLLNVTGAGRWAGTNTGIT